MRYQDMNARATDAWCESGWEWGRPISHEEYEKALDGRWDVRLTPTKPASCDQLNAELHRRYFWNLYRLSNTLRTEDTSGGSSSKTISEMMRQSVD